MFAIFSKYYSKNTCNDLGRGLSFHFLFFPPSKSAFLGGGVYCSTTLVRITPQKKVGAPLTLLNRSMCQGVCYVAWCTVYGKSKAGRLYLARPGQPRPLEANPAQLEPGRVRQRAAADRDVFAICRKAEQHPGVTARTDTRFARKHKTGGEISRFADGISHRCGGSAFISE